MIEGGGIGQPMRLSAHSKIGDEYGMLAIKSRWAVNDFCLVFNDPQS